MSFDLAFWRARDVPSPTDAARIYDELTDGIEGVVAPDPAVAAFHRDVIAAFPDLTEDTMHVAPWAAPLYVTPECVIAAVSWSRTNDVVPVLLDLARQHGLTTYDPQESAIRTGSAADPIA